MSYTMYVPTKVLFGAGMLNKLHEQNLPGKKAMIVISNGKSTRANGYLERTEKGLHQKGIETAVFDKVQPNPLKSTVMAGAKFAKENNCDFIVALGGGSCMDSSKAMAIMAVNEGDLWDYIASGTGKGKEIKNKSLPVVAITTTAGTGSESDWGAVITNEETNEKTGFGGEDFFPVLAIVDPELMTSVPPKFTAYQGFDALFHSVEGYISSETSLMSDMYAITAIENIGKYLLRAVKNGKDMEAREGIAFANSLSGTVMCVGACTSEHALEHALSAYHDKLPHGAGLIMISCAYYKHLVDIHAADDRFIRMAQALGNKSAKEPIDFVRTLKKLQDDCGVGELKMSEYGITPDEFPKMVENAKDTAKFLFATDRKPLSNDDCVKIYQDSFK